jgi:hypothetical protein
MGLSVEAALPVEATVPKRYRPNATSPCRFDVGAPPVRGPKPGGAWDPWDGRILMHVLHEKIAKYA